MFAISNTLVMRACDDSFIWFRWWLFFSTVSFLHLWLKGKIVFHHLRPRFLSITLSFEQLLFFCFPSPHSIFLRCIYLFILFSSFGDDTFFRRWWWWTLWKRLANGSTTPPSHSPSHSTTDLYIKYKIYNGFHFTLDMIYSFTSPSDDTHTDRCQTIRMATINLELNQKRTRVRTHHRITKKMTTTMKKKYATEILLNFCEMQ